jgi:hypothetical protein
MGISVGYTGHATATVIMPPTLEVGEDGEADDDVQASPQASDPSDS